MKSRLYALSALLLIVLFCGNTKAQKIVGYLPSYATPAEITPIVYSRMTDVVFCFLNCDASGNLILNRVGDANFDFEMEKLQMVKAFCQPVVANGPRLWIAIGGADGGNARANRLASVCGAAGTRATFISQLVAFANTHNMYGIDLDWEFPTPGQTGDLNNLILDLKAAAPALKLSIAVGGETVGACPAGHMAYFNPTAAVRNALDYYHIMAYDLPSSYNANHSSVANAATAIDNWNSCRGLEKAKMVVGIPFYAKTDPRSGVVEYNLIPGGTIATAFANDNFGGNYYHNSGNAAQPNSVQNKVHMTKSTNAAYNDNIAGVLIWDVSQDRSADNTYSLLKATYEKMNGNTSTNPCSTKPFIGKDTTKCNGATLVLNSNVTAASGGGITLTFQWYKDNVAIGSATATSYTVPADIGAASAYFKVVATQTSTGYFACVQSDSILVHQIADVTAPVASEPTVCSTGSPTSSSLSTTSSGTIKWYAAATGGSALATGSPYVVSPTATTTYYVQSDPLPVAKKYYGGRTAIMSAVLWNERTRNPTMMPGRPEWTSLVTVRQPLTLKSVVAYFRSSDIHSTAQLMVLDATLAATAAPVYTYNIPSIPATSGTEPWGVYPRIISPTSLTLNPGQYYIGVYNVNGGGSAPVSMGAGLEVSTSQLSDVANVFRIEANAYQNTGTAYGASVNYGQLFDFRFEGAALTQCARQSVTVTHNCPAPVELLEFSGYKEGNQNFLLWKTSSEINNDRFDVLRSENGIDFTRIGSISGAGNSNELIEYYYVDEFPTKNAYYRLAQYDFDGTVSYSNIILIGNNSDISAVVTPNPFENATTLHVKNGQDALVNITDAQGNVVYQEKITSAFHTINIGADFAAGVYFVQISSGSGIKRMKIIKQ